jgi:hypothetical protein
MELELRTISSYIEKISKKKGPNSILFKVEEVYIWLKIFAFTYGK